MINDETEDGVRVCYKGIVPKGYAGKKSDGTYTIRQYLKLADAIYEVGSNNRGGERFAGAPTSHRRGYTYLDDFERLMERELPAQLCSLKKRQRGWMRRCQDCEDSMKGDSAAAQRAQRQKRDRRFHRREVRRQTRRQADRGVEGAREALARMAARNARGRTRRAAAAAAARSRSGSA